MRRKFNYTIILIAVNIALTSCWPGNKGTRKTTKNMSGEKQSIMIFSAASLTDVLSEIVDSFEVRNNIKVKTNLASSGTLARQIEQGGSPDVYISASKKWSNYIDSLGYNLNGYKSDIAQNELVLIAPLTSTLEVPVIDSALDFTSLHGTKRLSVGDPSHVPAGRYAKQALKHFGWYRQLDNKILPAKDVRSALMVVEMEEAATGIVYLTDALKSDKVKILSSFPVKSHQPIEYVAGVCNDNDAAKDFFAYLNSNETKTIWKKYGFKK